MHRALGKAQKIHRQFRLDRLAGGPGGRPPLVIPADSFHLHFHSDASQQDWGFRVEAVAPVNMELATALHMDIQDEKHERDGASAADDDGLRLGLYSCQRALAECLNDLDRARAYLKEHAGELLEEERGRQKKRQHWKRPSRQERLLETHPWVSLRVDHEGCSRIQLGV